VSQRSDRLKRRREFQQQVIALDRMCMDCFKTYALGAHHIVHKRPNAAELDVPENGITLCPECHTKAHVGYKKGGEYVSPRQYVIDLLELLRIGNGVWRWGDVLAELQKRSRDVGR
jgi:hypothetical protein